MAEKANCTVYVGNLDERVSERVLYDILIQAGRVANLCIPRDKETDKPRGFAFVEYETEETAAYAVNLFFGLVTLYNRRLKFAVSRQDKPPSMESPKSSSPLKHPRPPNRVACNQVGVAPRPMIKSSTSCRFPEKQANYEHSNVYRSHYKRNRYDYN